LQVAELWSGIVLLRIGVYQLLSLRPRHESPTALPLRMHRDAHIPSLPSERLAGSSLLLGSQFLMAKINPLADWTQNMVWVHIGCTGQKGASSNLPSEPGRPYYF
jgi:hypothetical protein